MANNPNNIGEIIKKHIDKLDYMGFLRMGAPNDEYDVESQMILERDIYLELKMENYI